jgi:hypothetical protein
MLYKEVPKKSELIISVSSSQGGAKRAPNIRIDL